MTRGRIAEVALLAALVVAAASTGGAALAGATGDDTGCAHEADGQTAVEGVVAPALGPEDSDAAMASGRTHWAGQRLSFDGSAVVADVANASTAERTFQLRRVADGGDVGRLVREFVVDAHGEAVVRTGTLAGEFVVRYDGEPVYVQDGTGYAASPPDGSAVTVGSSAWEVAVQTLSASWSDDRVGRNEIVALHLESNRALYPVGVSAEGLTFEDLESIFDPHFYANDHDVRADEDVIVLRGGSDVDVSAFFAGIDGGEYVLSVEVLDADARTTAAVRVGRTGTTTAPPTTAPPPTATATATATAATASPGTTTRVSTSTAPDSTGAETTAPPATTTAPGQAGFDALGGALALVAAVRLWRCRR